MYEERQPVQDLVAAHQIPRSTISELSGVFRSEVSRYVRNQKVSDRDRLKIEQTVRDLAEFLEAIRQTLPGLSLNLRDSAWLRMMVEKFRNEMRLVEAQEADAQFESAAQSAADMMEQIPKF